METSTIPAKDSLKNVQKSASPEHYDVNDFYLHCIPFIQICIIWLFVHVSVAFGKCQEKMLDIILTYTLVF
jgi:hypothetical protein